MHRKDRSAKPTTNAGATLIEGGALPLAEKKAVRLGEAADLREQIERAVDARERLRQQRTLEDRASRIGALVEAACAARAART